VRCDENISTGAVLAWPGNTECLAQIHSANRGGVGERLEEHRANEGRSGNLLELRLNGLLHAGTRFVTSIGRE